MDQIAKVIQRVFRDIKHPRAEEHLDTRPVPYNYWSKMHGLSRHTVAVPRLVCKRLRRIEPWAEEDQEGFDLFAGVAEDQSPADTDELACIDADSYDAEGLKQEWDYDPSEGIVGSHTVPEQGCDHDDDANDGLELELARPSPHANLQAAKGQGLLPPPDTAAEHGNPPESGHR